MGFRVPIIRYLGLGNSNYSTNLGQVYDYWVLGPLGQPSEAPFWESLCQKLVLWPLHLWIQARYRDDWNT